MHIRCACLGAEPDGNDPPRMHHYTDDSGSDMRNTTASTAPAPSSTSTPPLPRIQQHHGAQLELAQSGNERAGIDGAAGRDRGAIHTYCRWRRSEPYRGSRLPDEPERAYWHTVYQVLRLRDGRRRIQQSKLGAGAAHIFQCGQIERIRGTAAIDRHHVLLQHHERAAAELLAVQHGRESGEMRVLVACEFSGIVRDAFKRYGHNA